MKILIMQSSLATSFLLSPNILLSILFPNTLSLGSSLCVRNQVSNPYKTMGKIIVLYILIFNFLEETGRQIFCISQMLDKKLEYNGSVYNLFIDFKRAYSLVGGKYCTTSLNLV
jgi:hypothetical protein